MVWDHWFKPGRKAAQWVVHLSVRELEDREWRAFTRWLESSPERQSAFLRQSATWLAASEAEPSPAIARALAAARKPRASRRPRTPWLAAAGAVAAACVALAVVTLQPRTVETGFGQTQKLALSDGSIVHLNTETSLTYRTTPWSRRIRLKQGDAFFEVAHDKDRPFTVTASGERVRAVGTQFSVERLGDGIVVAVAEGAVDVERSDGPRAAPATRVGAGYRLVRRDGGATSSLGPIPAYEVASWRNGQLIFDEATVGRIAGEVNRYSTSKLIIEDPAILQMTLGGAFPIGDPDALAMALRDIYGLRIAHRGRDLVVTK